MEVEPPTPSPATTLHFEGELVRLSALDPERDAEAFARWLDNPMSSRLAGWSPARPMNVEQARQQLQEWVRKAPQSFYFGVRNIAEDRLVGDVSLKDVDPIDQRAEMGIAIYQPEDWGKGFGREATILALRYAFNELNLHRVWLTTSSFNERAAKLYEKLGFRHEGRGREHEQRDGSWWDIVYMGLLRDEFNE